MLCMYILTHNAVNLRKRMVNWVTCSALTYKISLTFFTTEYDLSNDTLNIIEEYGHANWVYYKYASFHGERGGKTIYIQECKNMGI